MPHESPYTKKEPTHCDHCGNSLARLLHVYKGKNSERFYCSSLHLQRGELYCLEKKVAATGRSFAWDVT
jgi:hypothetical protein